jgi:uncharacterized membrane protein (DUF441 family)
VELNSNNLAEKKCLLEFTQLFWAASIVKILALILGAFIVYLAYKGYRRNASKPLLYVALGFGLITAGTLLEGVMFVVMGSDILEALATGTVLTVIGFVTIIYSIYSVK